MWTITALTLVIALLLFVLVFFYRHEQRKRRALERSMRLDPLTGACTRSAFESEAPQKLKLASLQNEKLTLCYVDVDKLKQVNDTHGHLHGDAYLKEVVSIIRARVRAGDEIYRIGGDEFVLIFPGCGPDEVSRIWDQVHADLDAMSASGRIPYTMGITHGCAAFNPQAPQDIATLLKNADQSMYTKKAPEPATP